MAPTLNNVLGQRANTSSASISANPGLVAGDTWVLWMSLSSATINSYDGWNIWVDEVMASTRRLYILWRNDFSGSTLGFTGSGNHGIIQGCLRGHNRSNPLAVSSIPTTLSSASGATVDAPAITPVVNNTLIVRTFHKAANSGTHTFSEASGMSEIVDFPGTGSAGHSVSLQTKTLVTAGTDAQVSSTASDSANPWGGTTIAFRSASDPGEFLPFFDF